RPVPLYRQLYDALRTAILGGQLRPGARLPATRTLALELGLSRTTVVSAMQQLLAEGYVNGRVGSGTYVADTLAHKARWAETAQPAQRPPSQRAMMLSPRGQALVGALDRARGDVARSPAPFRMGAPALDDFPWRAWGEIERRLARHDLALRGYGNPAGYA